MEGRYGCQNCRNVGEKAFRLNLPEQLVKPQHRTEPLKDAVGCYNLEATR